MRSFDRRSSPARRLDGLAPARRDEAGREIGKRCEDEQALSGETVRNDKVGRPGRVTRPRLQRALDIDLVTTEDEEVEVQLARTPMPAVATSECPLELLERDEERERAGRGIRPARDVERGCGVAELGLVGHPDRFRRVEAGDTTQPGTRQHGQGTDAGRDRRLRVAEVCPQSDVCPNPAGQCPPPAR